MRLKKCHRFSCSTRSKIRAHLGCLRLIRQPLVYLIRVPQTILVPDPMLIRTQACHPNRAPDPMTMRQRRQHLPAPLWSQRVGRQENLLVSLLRRIPSAPLRLRRVGAGGSQFTWSATCVSSRVAAHGRAVTLTHVAFTSHWITLTRVAFTSHLILYVANRIWSAGGASFLIRVSCSFASSNCC